MGYSGPMSLLNHFQTKIPELVTLEVQRFFGSLVNRECNSFLDAIVPVDFKLNAFC